MGNLLGDSKYGVIGAGSFGTTIANLLALNGRVILFSRNPETVRSINEGRLLNGIPVHPRIEATNNPAFLCEQCFLIFPIVPSNSFRAMLRTFSPNLHPFHILIHGTKGFDTHGIPDLQLKDQPLDRRIVTTMSEVILQESSVLRVGCLSGPNLSSEIMEGQPTATVIASQYDEVIRIGQEALDSPKFHVFGSQDLLGAELSGALKNMIAIGSGILGGLNLGKNLQAMLITRGLHEMIHIGKALGSNTRAFIGTAGIGDLVATAMSDNSRNYSFGMRLARGETYAEIMATLPELAEGTRTLAIVRQLARTYKLHVPISLMLYQVVFEGYPISKAIDSLIRYPYNIDVDFF